jgi:hypothetical protein
LNSRLFFLLFLPTAVILVPIARTPFLTIARINALVEVLIALPTKEHSRVFAKKAFLALNATFPLVVHSWTFALAMASVYHLKRAPATMDGQVRFQFLN